MAHEALYIPGEGVFPLLKPLVGFQGDILAYLERHPYDCNVFLMLRFREGNAELSRFIIETLARHGLNGIRADDCFITADAYNPIAVLYCCKHGIALLDEAETDQTFNPNVFYELGVMQSQGKSCLFLKHGSLPQVPFDLIKDIHWEYENEAQIERAIGRWVRDLQPASGPAPGGAPRIVTVEEESLVLGSTVLAGLAARGLRDVAPRLGGIDLATFLAGAETAIDVGSPLSLAALRPALTELRGFIRHREGVANFVFVDPEAPFAREGDWPDAGYAAELGGAIERIRSLVDKNAKASVQIYLHSFASGYSLFRRDDRMIVAPWNDGLEPESSPCLVLEKGRDPAGIFASYRNTFEQALHRKSTRLVWANRV